MIYTSLPLPSRQGSFLILQTHKSTSSGIYRISNYFFQPRDNDLLCRNTSSLFIYLLVVGQYQVFFFTGPSKYDSLYLVPPSIPTLKTAIELNECIKNNFK